MNQTKMHQCAKLAVLIACFCMTDVASAQPIKVAFSREITVFNDGDPDALNFPTRQVSYWNDLGITIDFESLTLGDPVTNQFQAQGIVFQTTPGTLVTDVNAQPDFVPSSGTQLLGDPSTPLLTPTVIECSFVTQENGAPSATTEFGCTVISPDGPGHTVSFYSPDDTLIHFVNVPGTTGQATVSFTSTAPSPPIARVVLELGDGTDSAAIDDVFFKQPIESLTPDLQGSGISAPLGALAGTTIALEVTVSNDGFETAQPTWVDSLYRSNDPNWDMNDLHVATFTASVAVPAGESYTRQHNLTLPSLAGQYYLILRLDENNDLEEGYGESNNTFVTAPINVQAGAQPDLQVTSIDNIGLSCGVLDGVVSGQTIAVTYTVTNASTNNGPTTGSWVDSVFLTQLPSLNMSLGSETLLGQFGNATFLAPGESYESTVNVQLPEDLIDGCYYVVVYTDNRKSDETAFVVGGSYDVPESSETNNQTASGQFQVELAPQPDLVVDASAVSFFPTATTVQSWTVFSVTWAVRNQGGATTETGDWIDVVYLSENALPSTDGDFLLGSLPRVGLPLGPTTTEFPTRTLERLLPPTLNGTFYVKIHVDVDDAVTEIDNEGNNVFVCPGDMTCPLVTVVTGILPDLDNPPNTTFASSPAIAGTAIDVTWTGENLGAYPPEPASWRDAIYLSADNTFEETDQLLGKRTVNSVPDGVNHLIDYTVTKSVLIPEDTVPGNYYLFVRLDDELDLAPSHTSNVTPNPFPLTVSASSANLAVTADPASPDPAPAGATVTLTWTVQNSGTGPLPASTWRDRVYLSGDTTPDESDRVLSTRTQTAVLTPGGPPLVTTVSVVVPAVATGPYNLLFEVDELHQVPETNEGDNVAVVPFFVNSASADLFPTLNVATTIGTAGSLFAIDWTVTNQGSQPTLTPRWIDRVYLATSATLDGSETVLAGRRHTGTLVPTADYSHSIDVLLPLDASGAYHLILVTDAGGVVFEQGLDGNNQVSIPITVNSVPLPDLVVTQTDGASAAVSGQDIAVTWTVQNQGTGPTLTAEWQDNVYLSPDPFLDPGADVYLGTVTHTGVLAAGAQYLANASLPSTLR